MFRNAKSFLFLCSFFIGGVAFADWTGWSTITEFRQDSNNTMYITLSPTPNTPCATDTLLYLPENGQGYATGFKSLAPFLLAAYLYNKSINVDYTGCTAWGVPLITGVHVKD